MNAKNAGQFERMFRRPDIKGSVATTSSSILRLMDFSFRTAMDRFAPFEQRPHLAVAVSGGSDSIALCLMAADWARKHGGRITALTVDHGLRPASADEARWVAAEMLRIGVDHHVLPWFSSPPASGLQAAARAARYDLLRRWCLEAGVLHLLTGHQQEDQAETHLMRKARIATTETAGNLGLAGMSACVEFPEVRLLRPLLSMARRDLIAYLKNLGQGWLEDPSNQNAAFERVRSRQRLMCDEAALASALAQARAAAGIRCETENTVNRDLARCLSVQSNGFAYLDIDAFGAAAPARRPLIIARLVMALGGLGYAPRMDRLERLASRIASDTGFAAATLGRCRFLAYRDGRVLICRETRNLPPAIELDATIPAVHSVNGWDGRFDLEIPVGLPENVSLQALGPTGWRQVPKFVRAASGVPQAAALGMPALFTHGALYWSPITGVADHGQPVPTSRFRPKNTLAFTGFCIA